MGCLTSCDRLMPNPSALRTSSRSKRAFMTIRTRLTLWYSSLLATVIVVFGISLFSILQWAWRSQIDENIAYVVDQMQKNIYFNPDTEQIAVHMPKILDLVPYYSLGIQVWRADGTLAGSSTNLSQFT